MSITFHYSASSGGVEQSEAGQNEAEQSETNHVGEEPLGCHVEAKATAKSRIPVVGRKLEKSVVSSLGSSLDRTIERINNLATQTWGQ